MRSNQDILVHSREFAVEVPWKNWWVLLSTLTAFCATGVVTLSPLAWPLRLLASVVLGGILVRVFVIYHDCQHGAMFRKSPLARAFLYGFGYFFFKPPESWNWSHNTHHQHNGKLSMSEVGSFPLKTVDEYKALSPKSKKGYRFLRSGWVLIAFAYATVFFFENAKKIFKGTWAMHVEAFVTLALHFAIGYFMYQQGAATFMFAFIIPYVVSCAFGAYLFYAQHFYPEATYRLDDEWDYVNSALKSSSYLDSNRIVHWFSGNIGYHHVHHLNAKIPLYRLPEAMKAIPELNNPSKTNLSIREITRCLRLHLWDPRQNRLVAFDEIS